MGLHNAMGVQSTFLFLGGTGSVSTTNLDIDSNFSFGVSGDAFLVRFNTPVAQTSGNLTVYAYLVTKTGSPTSVTCAIYAGSSGADDAQRPNSTVVATVTNDLSAASNATWQTFSLTGVTLTQGATYWVIITNGTGTPGSNFPQFRVRSLNLWTSNRMPGYITADGVATDPSLQGAAADGPIVIKFDDNSLMGNPYVVTTAHANNQNDRGQRFKFDADVDFAGFIDMNMLPAAATGTFDLYQGASLLESITLDRSQANNAGVVWFSQIRRFTAGVAYDLVWNPTSNTTIGLYVNAGASAPADVDACLLQNFSYVDGATPGSYTATVGAITSLILMPDNLVAAAAGGGTGFFIQ
jgi:hypothetical protein